MKLRYKILSLLGILALFVGVFVATQVEPAGAHVYDPTAAWTCGATRPASNWVVVHAYPDYLTATFMEEVCIATLTGHQPIYWYAVYQFGPPANLYRSSAYIDWYGAPPG